MSKSAVTTPVKTGPVKTPKPDKKVVTFEGVVESDSRAKTRKVVVRFMARHAKYGKFLRKETVIQAHDEANSSKVGDVVEVGPCRPMSKTKTWRVLRVVKAAG